MCWLFKKIIIIIFSFRSILKLLQCEPGFGCSSYVFPASCKPVGGPSQMQSVISAESWASLSMSSSALSSTSSRAHSGGSTGSCGSAAQPVPPAPKPMAAAPRWVVMAVCWRRVWAPSVRCQGHCARPHCYPLFLPPRPSRPGRQPGLGRARWRPREAEECSACTGGMGSTSGSGRQEKSQLSLNVCVNPICIKVVIIGLIPIEEKT